MNDTLSLDDRLDVIYEGVLDYQSDKVAQLVRQEVELGTDINLVLSDALIAAMDEVGSQFAEGSLFVPEMLMAATAMKAGLNILRPLLTESESPSMGTIVLGTVKQDLHDIGKNLVGMMMEGAGFEVIDLGVDVPPEKFVEAAKEHSANLVGMSALLTTTMPNMGRTVEAFHKSGYNGSIIIGGAPLNQEFADSIGANGFADSAPAAVELARRLIGA